MLSLKQIIKIKDLLQVFSFSLGPPSAIIETQKFWRILDEELGFSLGPPSAIIETKRQAPAERAHHVSV